jgi:hypothetical protein
LIIPLLASAPTEMKESVDPSFAEKEGSLLGRVPNVQPFGPRGELLFHKNKEKVDQYKINQNV